ncbi:DUF58 domain-containing protein [Sphaerisporangium fuscum]|uniref:DUF58 domain-containing protein n=1 Tax=Sphaerisporangium fuscum TaxID=2835868 RepID=UPI001BDBD20A|nr:DUF58 domain-containing protein [Sphaerisporangium fuscum]
MLTGPGRGVLIGALLLYALAFVLGYPELVVLASGGVIALIAALVWTLPQARLSVRRELTPVKVSRGEAAVAVLHVENHGRWTLAGLRARDRVGAADHVVELPRLRGGAARAVSYALPTDTRGEIGVGPLAVVREDPLGLTRNVAEYGEAASLLVRPRTVPLGVLPSGRAHHLEGPSGDRAPSGTATFHTLREYVVGDDLRHVHWRSSARTGTLMVRRLVDASLPTTTVALDTRAVSYVSSDFELAVEAAASVAAGAARAGFPVRVVTGEQVVADLKGGGADVEAVLDKLAVVRPCADPAADPVRAVRPGGALVVVTGEPGGLDRVAAARRRHDRTVCLRIAPSGGPVSAPGVTVVDVPDLESLAAAWPAASR